jgi:predicted tellurium resistance membrane protein TerC
MIELLSSPDAWISLATLSFLEIVLGIDNLIFISIMASKLPEHQQHTARLLGLGLALVTRLVLLASVVWLVRLTAPILDVGDLALSWRDIILIVGGMFLLAKATLEIHSAVEGEEHVTTAATASGLFALVVAQIVALDVIFSLDSVLTAVGLTDKFPIMATAIVLAILVMIFLAKPLSGFVERHPTVKMLALSFLLLIGLALTADGLHFHIPRGYLYFAIVFSVMVEVLNLLARRNRKNGKRTGNA